MKTIITIILIVLCSVSYGQKMISTVHHYNTRKVNVAAILTAEGFGGELAYSKVNNKANTLRLALSYDQSQLETTTKYQTVSTNFTYLLPIVKESKAFYISIGGGAYLGYDMARNDILDINEEQFSPGVVAKTDAEYYFNKIGFYGSIEEIYRPNSLIGDWQWRASIGLKIVISN